MANKQRLSDTYSPELIDLINKNLKESGESKLISFLEQTDTRSSFRKYMFGEDKELDTAIKSIKEFSKVTSELNKASLNKRRYGILSDLKKASLERTQRKDFKKITSVVEQRAQKFQSQQAMKRMFTLSKGKKILSLREEKHMLEASKDYLSEMLEEYMKKGFSEDSKEVRKLTEDIHKSEKALHDVNFTIFKLKGGDKHVAKQIEQIQANNASKTEEIQALKESFDVKLKEHSEELQELINDGFDEQSDVIKQMRKDQEALEKAHESKVKKLQEEIDKNEKEVGYLRRRSTGSKVNLGLFGGLDFDGKKNGRKISPKLKEAFRKLIDMAKKTPKKGVGAAIAGTAYTADSLMGGESENSFLAEFIGETMGIFDPTDNTSRVVANRIDEFFGPKTYGSSAKDHHYDLHRYSYGSLKERDKMILHGRSIAEVETSGRNDYTVNNDVDRGISVGRFQYNLGQKSIGEVKALGLSPKAFNEVREFIGKKNTNVAYGYYAKNKISKQTIIEINEKWISKSYREFSGLTKRFPFLNDLSLNEMGVLSAAYNNAPGMVESVLTGVYDGKRRHPPVQNKNQLYMHWHNFRESGNINPSTGKPYRDKYRIAGMAEVSKGLKAKDLKGYYKNDATVVPETPEQKPIEMEPKVRRQTIVDEIRKEQGWGDTPRDAELYRDAYKQDAIIKRNTKIIHEKVKEKIQAETKATTKEVSKQSPDVGVNKKGVEVQATAPISKTQNASAKNIVEASYNG